jgi:DNA recombination protein RmuC
MELPLLIFACVLLLIAIILIIVFRNKSGNELPRLLNKLAELQTALANLESGLKQDFKINREENANIAKENRTELNSTQKEFILEQRSRFEELKLEQKDLTQKTVEQL